MQIRQLPLLTAALLLTASALVQQAMAQNGPQGTQHNMPGMSDGARTPANKAMMTGMEKMQNEMMAAPMTGDPDKDFVAMMKPHHQGAIEMAEVELQYGKDPEIRKLATAIIAAQKNEIAEMAKWQANHPAK